MYITSYLFYIVAYIISSILFYLAQKSDRNKINKRKYIFLILSFCIVFFISGWRFGIGTDYFNYIDKYMYVTNLNDFSTAINSTELGFTLLIYITKILFNDAQYLFVISSFLTLLFFYITIWEYRSKINVGFALFIYLLLFHNISFNAVKQFLSIAIVIFSFRYIFKLNFFKYFLTIIIASLFHYTAIIMIPIYFLYGNKLKNIYFKFILFVSITVSLLLFNDLLDYFNNLTSVFGYSGYLVGSESSQIGIGALITRLPIILIILFFRTDLKKYDERTVFLVDLLLLEMLLSFFGYKVDYFVRLLFQFNIAQILLFPFLFKALIKNKTKFPLIAFVILTYILIVWFQQLSVGITNDSIPYNNIFEWIF